METWSLLGREPPSASSSSDLTARSRAAQRVGPQQLSPSRARTLCTRGVFHCATRHICSTQFCTSCVFKLCNTPHLFYSVLHIVCGRGIHYNIMYQGSVSLLCQHLWGPVPVNKHETNKRTNRNNCCYCLLTRDRFAHIVLYLLCLLGSLNMTKYR